MDDNKDADATNTHGKDDLKPLKEKLWKMVEKIDDDLVKKASALKSVTDATTSEQLLRIESRLKELINE